jgi:glycosyltransferase involved in cell wall biosynthesis
VRVSIVTISYNQVEFLERAILSVVEQRGAEVEYIVVDPGSTDGSRELIDRYADRIAHRLYEPDQGPADGLNKGFSLATGEIYGYLNSDDVLEPGALAKVVDFFGRNPEIDVVSGHGWVIGPDDRRLRRIWSDRFRRRHAAYGTSIQIQPSTFIRREAFKVTGGFNIENRSNWDGELMVDLFLSGARFAVIDGFLSGYRLHAVSITNSGTLDAKINLWSRRAFEKLMGREPNRLDAVRGLALRLRKHVANPRATLERIRRGPVYRRGVG